MIRIHRWVGALGLLAVAACSDRTGPSDSVQLAAVSPAPGASAVPTATTITLTFSHGMAMGMEQYLDLHLGGIGGPVVPMTCAWSPDRTTLTCSPGSPLQPGTPYTIHLGGGMRDQSGHRMDLDEWTGTGGQWATSGMMGGMHDSQPVGMMGSGWRHGMDHYGMTFTFTTS